MISLRASEIAEIIGGVLHGDDIEVTSPAFLNSGDCIPGSIFLAIAGERVDGHDYVADAFAHGAALAITSKPVADRSIVVADVTISIGKLAKAVRNKLSSMTVIGITGSQGKTTAKEYLLSILSNQGATIATIGNNNNELGVPLTLLRCTEETRYCIVEIGARHKGDISALAEIAQPSIGVVLRVAAAHIGEFGSIEDIADTKSEMIRALSKEGIAILGNYDPYTPRMTDLHQGKTLVFGESASSDIRATDVDLRGGHPHFELVTPEGRSVVELHQYGLHQIPNALAAAAVGFALGISADAIALSLSSAEITAKWRMEVREVDDLLIINDAYNASPDSMVAALETLAHLSQERGGESWAFLGNMRELGEISAQAHASVAASAEQLRIDHLITIAAPDYRAGLSENSSVVLHEYQDREAALELVSHIHRGDVLLFKASRSDKFEEVAGAVEERWHKKLESEGDSE